MADVVHTKIEDIEELQGFERYPLDPDHVVRVDPAVVRKITAGPDGLRLLAIGGTPGRAYDPGGTL